MEADYYFFRSSYQFAPVYFIWGCDLFCSRIVSICHAGTNDLSIKAFLWPICSLETVINGDKQNWKSTYYLHGKTGNSLCHFTLGTSENMGYVQFWRCNVSSFLVSSLADLDLPCSGSLSNNVKCIVTCFCSRYSTRWFVSPVSTHTLALRYLPGPSCSKLG